MSHQSLPTPKLLIPIAFFGLFGLALPYTLYPIAQRSISSALAGSLNATTPAWTLVLTWIFARKSVGRPTASGISGIAIGLAGVILMLRPWEATGTLTGSLIALCASACYGISNVIVTNHLSGNIHPAPLAALQMGFAALFCAMFLPTGPIYLRCSWIVALAICFLGVLGTGIAQAIFLRVIEQDGAVVASTVTYLVPLVAISIGPLVLHEQLAWTTLAGMAITLAGVWLSRHR